jgi:hypothetical protein
MRAMSKVMALATSFMRILAPPSTSQTLIAPGQNDMRVLATQGQIPVKSSAHAARLSVDCGGNFKGVRVI